MNIRLLVSSVIFLAGCSLLCAQASDSGDWEKAAGGKMSFDVSSVKQNTSGGNAAHTNFPWAMTSEVPQTGGLFLATNWPLYQYIFFAYKADLIQQTAILDALPKWTKSEHFDIEARAQGNPTGDQYRLMIQSLLADRFKLAVHFETRDVPVFDLVLAKPGKLGSQLRLHVDDPPCDGPSSVSPAGLLAADPDGFPQVCGRVGPVRPKMQGPIAAFGGRDVTLTDLANRLGYLAISELGRPLIDGTGLKGKVDVFIEWAPPVPPNPNITPAPQDAPGLAEAFSQQLGLKLEAAKAPLKSIVIDQIEEPWPN